MARILSRSVGFLLAGAVFAAATPGVCRAHLILDPEVVRPILSDIAKYQSEAKEDGAEERQLEALYRLGEEVEFLIELMNQDRKSHGVSDLFAKLIVKRLQAYGIGVTFVESTRQYSYDFGAFQEYLRRSPRGDRSSDIRFQLISHTFYQSIGTDPAKLLNTDVAGVLQAVAEQEKFLRDYPNDKRAKEVRFFLAVNYYRLYRNSRNLAKAKEYRTLARDALTHVMKRYPGTIEARGAEGLLETIQETWKGSRLQPTIPLVLAMKQSEEPVQR
ncbi:MAG: tol-pal system YbgF family protein [Candidatus Methylomirabilales bacterium]